MRGRMYPGSFSPVLLWCFLLPDGIRGDFPSMHAETMCRMLRKQDWCSTCSEVFCLLDLFKDLLNITQLRLVSSLNHHKFLKMLLFLGNLQLGMAISALIYIWRTPAQRLLNYLK